MVLFLLLHLLLVRYVLFHFQVFSLIPFPLKVLLLFLFHLQSHFLLHLPFTGSESDLKISVIDLHRAQLRNKVPIRWRDKDLIGLYFSSLNIGLTSRDLFRFMKTYFGLSLREIIRTEQALMAKASVKAEKIQERTIRKSL